MTWRSHIKKYINNVCKMYDQNSFKKNLRILKKIITFLFKTMFGKTEYKISMGWSDVLFHQQ